VLTYGVLGFLAALVDGTLGFGYGMSLTAGLLVLGLPPASASASVHAAELVTSAASAVSHAVAGNVDRALFRALVLTGALGALLGGSALLTFAARFTRPIAVSYLLALLVLVVYRQRRPRRGPARRGLPALGFLGGFCDAAGGGGWGPIVTLSLLARGLDLRYAVGSANAAELFVTISAVAVEWPLVRLKGTDVLGLIVGGLLAAPLAAILCRWLSARASRARGDVRIAVESDRAP